MNKNRLLILTETADHYLKLLLKSNLDNIDFVPASNIDRALTAAKDCNIILGNPEMISRIINSVETVEWVQSSFAGNESLCHSSFRRDYILTGIKDIFGPLMSEHVFTYILAIERNIFGTMNNQKNKIWKEISYRSLRDLHFGVCGYGSIGKHIASTAKYFGMKVSVFKRTKIKDHSVDFIYSGPDEFKEFLAPLDYLVIVLPKTERTTGIINSETLSFMKSDSVIINVGRGNAIIEKDLEEALEKNRIKGAVLDVFNKEPLPQDSKFWLMPDVYITPHISAYSFPEDIIKIFADNYKRFCNKEPLKYLINFERGY